MQECDSCSLFFYVRCSLLFWVRFYHSFCGRAVGQPFGAPRHSMEQSTGWITDDGLGASLILQLDWIMMLGLDFFYNLAEEFSTICELFVVGVGSHVLEHI